MTLQKLPTAACPVSCRYCVITQVGYRAEAWRKKFLIGLNKAVTILNPPPVREDGEALASFYNFPLELLEADRVGFNAISDPFWPKYRPELEWFLDSVAPIVKAVTCVTKFPVSESLMKRLALVPNFQLNVSITGLDSIERSTTESRLRTLALAREYGVSAFPTIHPYIAGMSNLEFLRELRAIGYQYVDVKGLRYDPAMADWMPEVSRKFYEGTEGREILPEDGWREKIAEAGLCLKSLRIWGAENSPSTPKLSREAAKSRVARLLCFANITSSDSDAAVINAAIERRL
jgi:DNA repair photolyase